MTPYGELASRRCRTARRHSNLPPDVVSPESIREYTAHRANDR